MAMDDKPPDPKVKPVVSSRRRFVIGGLTLLFIAIVIALSVGLGVGLSARNKKSSPSPQSDSRASPVVQSWRRNTADYSLDMASWDLKAPPTTRSYNFTVGELTIAPDGRHSIFILLF
jgi:hypothetical protein